MGYNKAKAEKKWKEWKNKEENLLRKLGMNEDKIDEFRKFAGEYVLERLGYVTFVECVLETGRTHQIRVHMKHIGHPLFNDLRYGGSEILKGTHFSKYKQFVMNCFETCPRQALHAKTLGFVHPRTGEQMFFTSELPEDMTLLLEKWRAYIGNREI